MHLTSAQRQGPAKADPSPAAGVLQRKCACGNHTAAGGKCIGCRKKEQSLQRKATSVDGSSTLAIQRKLTVGTSDDPLEKEADQVADQVMAMPANAAPSKSPIRIQRYTGSPTGAIMEAPPSVEQALSSPGSPLEPELRRDMEYRFGYNFSGVRVHSSLAANQSAKDLHANAYTAGNHLVFRTDQFNPSTLAGKRLIAHELSHVIQQLSPDGVSTGASASPLMAKNNGNNSNSQVRYIQRQLAFTANPPVEITNQFVDLVNRLLPSGWRFRIDPTPSVRPVPIPLGTDPFMLYGASTSVEGFNVHSSSDQLELVPGKGILESRMGILERYDYWERSPAWQRRFQSELLRLIQDTEISQFKLISRDFNPETEEVFSDSFLLGMLDITDLESMPPIAAAAALVHALEERRSITGEASLEDYPWRHLPALASSEARVMGGLIRRDCEGFTIPARPDDNQEYVQWMGYFRIRNGRIIEEAPVTAIIYRMINSRILTSRLTRLPSYSDFRRNNPQPRPAHCDELTSSLDSVFEEIGSESFNPKQLL